MELANTDSALESLIEDGWECAENWDILLPYLKLQKRNLKYKEEIYYCNLFFQKSGMATACNHTTIKEGNMQRHIKTKKHQQNISKKEGLEIMLKKLQHNRGNTCNYENISN